MNPLLDLTAHPVIAHRGASAEAPENTLPAFEAATKGGADAFELDVRLTADGAPVVIHDATLDRTTDRMGPVRGLTLAELRSVDAGSRFAPARGQEYPFRGQ
ncbi:MAG TPA: glycerophosphodiester phosphodiesterase family protein, partial [Gemmatimonadales bacterium]